MIEIQPVEDNPVMPNRARVKARRGERMTKGAGWKLEAKRGRRRYFPGTLLATFNFGNKRIAVFSVPK